MESQPTRSTQPLGFVLVRLLVTACLIATARSQWAKAADREAVGQNSPIEELIAALESEDVNQWSRATTFLGNRANEAERAVPALVRAIERPQVRYSAVAALKQLGPAAEGAIPALIKTISDYPDDPSSRWEASKALVSIGPAAVPALKQAAESANPVLKVWARAALVKSESSNSPSLRYLADTIRGKGSMASEALQTIKMLGPLAASIVPQLKEAMKDSSIPQKEFIEALARIGKAAEPALPEILKALETKDALGKIEAIRATKAINGPSARAAVPLLVEALEPKENLDPFAEKLDPFSALQQPRIREEAAEALGTIGPSAKAAIPALVRALSDPEERVRANAVTAIKRIDPTNSQALAGLINAMGDASFRVQYAANAALLKAGPVNIEVIRGFIGAVRQNAKHFTAYDGYDGPADNIVPVAQAFFYRLGPEHRYAVDDLAELARDPRPGVQRIAFIGLTSIGEIAEEFVPTLIKQLPDHWWAHSALKKMGPKAKAAVPQLITMLQDKRQRHAAADLLASIGGPAANPAILVLEHYVNEAQFPEVNVCRALMKLDPASRVALDGFEKITTMQQNGQLQTFDVLEAHARLIQRGRDPEVHLRYLGGKIESSDERVRAVAVKMVMESTTREQARTEAFERIFQFFESGKDEWAIEVAAQGLEFVRPQDKAYVPKLVRALSRPRRGERINALVSAITALGLIGPEAREALPQLKATLEYQFPRIYGYEDSNDSLNRPTRTVRAAAQDAIRKIEQGNS